MDRQVCSPRRFAARGALVDHSSHRRRNMAFKLPGEISLTYLGHSTFHLVTPGGVRLLIDPWVQNNPRCPADKKDLGKLDRMLITHGHYDHIGDAVEIGKATGAQAFANFETVTWLGSKGIANVAPMNKGGTIRDGGIAVTMVHA